MHTTLCSFLFVFHMHLSTMAYGVLRYLTLPQAPSCCVQVTRSYKHPACAERCGVAAKGGSHSEHQMIRRACHAAGESSAVRDMIDNSDLILRAAEHAVLCCAERCDLALRRRAC